MFREAKASLEASAQDWPSGVLTLALLAAAALVVLVALLPGRPLLKAAVLAWVVFP